MELVGYSDRLSVAPGETIRFMVSSSRPRYRAQVVRLIHGDTNPDGPGFKEEEVATPVTGEYPGRVQALEHGSHVLVPDRQELRLAGGFTVQARVFPTAPGGVPQGVVARWPPPPQARPALL